MQRASLVEKSRQKPQDRMRTLTDVSLSYCALLYICSDTSFSHNLIFQAVRNHLNEEDPMLKACGLSIDTQLAQVDGRILDTPRVNVFSFLSHERVCLVVVLLPGKKLPRHSKLGPILIYS